MKESVRLKLRDAPNVRAVLGDVPVKKRAITWVPGMSTDPELTGSLEVELDIEDVRLRSLLLLDPTPLGYAAVGQWEIVRRYTQEETRTAEFFVALPARWESPEYLVLDVRNGRLPEQDWRAFDRSEAIMDYSLSRGASKQVVLHTANGFVLVRDELRSVFEQCCPADARFHTVRALPASGTPTWDFNRSPSGRELLRLYKQEHSPSMVEFWDWLESTAPRQLAAAYFADEHRREAERASRAVGARHRFWRLSVVNCEARIDTSRTLVGGHLRDRILGASEWRGVASTFPAEADSLGSRLLSHVALHRSSLAPTGMQATHERIGYIEQEFQASRLLIVRRDVVAALERSKVRGFVFEPVTLV